MARLDYRQKTKLKIWLLAIMLILCVCILSACNNNSGTYDLSNVDNASQIQSMSSSSLTGFIRNSLIKLNDKIGNFGWTVVCFTIILRLILSPLDIWQKLVARKNSKAMKRMKPELEALNEKYADDKQRLQQETQALYKREKYSMLGSCLPMILTLVVFFLVFAGFRDMVGYQYAKDFQTSRDTYYSQYNDSIKQKYDELGVTYTVIYNEGLPLHGPRAQHRPDRQSVRQGYLQGAGRSGQDGMGNDFDVRHDVAKLGQAARHVIGRRHQTHRLESVAIHPVFAFQRVLPRVARDVSQRDVGGQLLRQFVNGFRQ